MSYQHAQPASRRRLWLVYIQRLTAVDARARGAGAALVGWLLLYRTLVYLALRWKTAKNWCSDFMDGATPLELPKDCILCRLRLAAARR